MPQNFQDKVNFIFGIADALRGPYRPNQYGKVILPFTVLRRMDCVLAPTRAKVRAAYEKHKGKPEKARESILNRAAGQQFHNTSQLDFEALKGDANRKQPHRRGKVQLIDATRHFVKMRKSLGNKRNEIGDGQDGKPDHIAEITRVYGDFRPDDTREVRSNGDTLTRTVGKIFDIAELKEVVS